MESSNLLSKEKEEKRRINPSDKYVNIKSDYILKRVFNNLEKKKKLNIVRYNNNIKKRLNININDYEEYSLIEIEIKPMKDKYDKFINIKKYEEKYFRIYFNKKKKKKRNYIKKDEEIKIIKIIIDYRKLSFKSLFKNCDCIESINFKKFHRNNINSMKGMFNGCFSLKELILNNFNTINVTDMSLMFNGCSSLKELNLNKI